MKKITFVIFMSLLSFCGYSQLAMEGFETGWTLAATGTGTTDWFTMQNGVGLTVKWVQGAANNTTTQPAYAGERAAYLQKENVTTGIPEDYLVSKQFSVPQNPEIHFFSRLTTPGDQGSIYKVFILNLTANPTADLNSPASYTELQTWTELQINPVQTEYVEKVVIIPDAYVGANVRIAFMMAGDDADRWLVDNVSVVKRCVDPQNLTVDTIGLTSATLSWENTSEAPQWEIELVGENDTPTGAGITVNTMPYTFTNLTEDTCYKYYVRALCDGGGKSGWVGAYYFCTKRIGDDCNDPIAITTLPFSDSDNTGNFADTYEGVPGTGCGNSPWENYLSGNDVVYKYTANFTGAVNIDLSDNGPYSGIFIYNECENIGVSCLEGGTAGQNGTPVSFDDFAVVSGEDYYIVISSYDNPTTPYTLTIQAVACDEPTNLSVDNVGMTAADLSWDNPTGATSWGLVVQPQGTGVPQGAGTTVTDNSDYTWSNLTASTAYEFWVRADCGNGTFSAWAGPFRFNTMICEVAFQCEFTFTMWDQWDTWNGHTMSVKQNGVTLATLTGPGSDGQPVDQVVKVCDNMPVQLFWNAGGSTWAGNEIAISVKNSFNQEIYVKDFGEGLQNTLLYEVLVDCENPYCLAPKGLTATNATETTVDLAWNGPATGEWEYFIVPEGAPAPADTDTGVLTTTNPTVAAGPLVASTNYEYYVRMHCENASTDVSPWSTASKFSSSVCDPATKCEYQFVLTAPWDGWDDDVLLTVRQNNTNVALLGPGFTSGTTMTVNVPLCSNIPFEIFWNDDAGWGGQVGIEVINNFDQTLFLQELYSNAGAGSVIFSAAVDCDHPACLPPTGLTASNGTMTSIDLAWDGPATGAWEYIVLPAGSPAPTPATPGVATATNPAVAVPLAAPATNYEYYVRVVCTGAAEPTSTWAGPYAMHSEACNPEDKCMFHFELLSENGWNFSDNRMTVYQGGVPAVVLGPGFDWNAPDSHSYMVDVPLCPGLEVEIVWENQGYDQDDKALHVYSPYWEDVFVKDFGEGNQGETIFTGLVSCDPPACIKPIELAVNAIGENSVELSWNTQGSTATSWEVWVLPFGSPVPDPAVTPGTVVTTNPYTAENLTSGTPYVYYVRANCGTADGYSTISSPRVFVTAIENDDCDEAINVPVNSGLNCTEFTPGTVTGATSSGVANDCNFSAPDYDVWYKFTATGDSHAVALNDATGVSISYAVFEGDDCGNLTEIACEYPNYPENGAKGVVHGLTVGSTYYIQVYASYMPNPSDPTSFNICITTPASIVVDDTIAVEDIVMNTLFVESCASPPENITYSTGTDAGVNGIAYFEKGLSNFGIENGIVLMTGVASQAPGPNLGANLSGGSWAGDQQLFDYITDLGIDPNLYTYNDATVLEFDFTPLASKLRFPFVFASEEYGQYQCDYSDAFAFFLTPLDAAGTPDGPVTNLAIVPGTNDPVSVVTIRDNNFNPIFSDCPSVNPEYFADYYGPTANIQNPDAAVDPMFAPINFNGSTVKMYAESDVIPNKTYHIKLVIADRNDNSMDSAVFIGAFDIGKPDLGEDLTINDGNGVCSEATYTIESTLSADDYTFTWYKKEPSETVPNPNEFVEITGATGPTYTVSNDDGNGTGEYKVVASFGGLCSAEDSIVIEFYNAIVEVTGEPTNLIVCDADGFGTFNLSDNTPVILAPVTNPANYTISYHLTEADAQDNLNPLPETDYDNVTQGNQQIYVRIVNEKGCVGIKTFALVVQDLTPAFTINDDFSICENTTTVISVSPAQAEGVTYSWTFNGTPIAETTPSITVSTEGTYEVTVNNQGCTATDAVVLTVIPTPVADELDDVIVCSSYVLPVLNANNNYFSGTGSTGTQYSAGDVITASGEIFIVARNSASGECFAESSFVVTIIPTATVAILEECHGNDYVLEANFDNDEVYTADNVTFEWKNEAGATLGTNATLTITEVGNYYLTVTPVGNGSGCPVTVEAQIDNTTCLIPRGISPNGDGKNDEFDLTTLNVKKLEIFNRYGQEVYSKSNYTKEFIGKGSNGDELPTGTYYYMIERQNGETKTGWVYINRQE